MSKRVQEPKPTKSKRKRVMSVGSFVLTSTEGQISGFIGPIGFRAPCPLPKHKSGTTDVLGIELAYACTLTKCTYKGNGIWEYNYRCNTGPAGSNPTAPDA